MAPALARGEASAECPDYIVAQAGATGRPSRPHGRPRTSSSLQIKGACASSASCAEFGLRRRRAPAERADDGTITVLVARDVDGDGGYTPEVDEPQSGVTVTVTDAGGSAVSDTSDEAGLVVVEPTDELSGGRYFVTAEIPEDLGLAPVPAGANFAPMSSTVDVTSEDQTVRVGVTARAEPEPTTAPAAPPRVQPPAATT